MARKRSGNKGKKPPTSMAAAGVGGNDNEYDDVGNGRNYTTPNGHYYYRNGSNGGGHKYGSNTIPIWMKRIAVVVSIVAIFHKTLWPWGIASPLSSNTERSNYASIDYTNDSLMSKRKFTVPTTLSFLLFVCVYTMTRSHHKIISKNALFVFFPSPPPRPRLCYRWKVNETL